MSALQTADAIGQRRSHHKIATPPGIPHADPWLAECLARGKTERFRVTVDLNPVTGQALLDINTHNRDEKPTKQIEWAAMMSEGRWLLTHQGMAVDWNGVVLDGQNRLRAVVLSGSTIQTHIEFGCNPDEMNYIDTGMRRSAEDSVKLAGKDNARLRTAIARLMNVLDTRELGPLDPARARALVNTHDTETMRTAIHRGQMLSRKVGGGITPAGGVLACYLIATKSERAPLLPRFLEEVVGSAPTGIPLGLRDKAKERRLTTAKVGIVEKSIKHAAAVILAWNAYSLSKKSAVLTWDKVVQLPGIA